jgi:Protein of unknown function/Domain of unknown function (DUF1835)
VSSDLLHVLFNSSAAGELRRALAIAGRNDRVVCSFDDLSFGPINPPDADLRARWVAEEMGYAGWQDVVAKTTQFWSEALAPGRKVAWMSRRTTLEYAGFLEWLWRLGDEPCDVVDLTDVMVVGRGQDGKPTPPSLALSLALLPVNQILDNGLIDRAQTLTPEARRQHRETWHRLRAENAALRVLNADGLVSAPVSFFDPLLLTCATSNWQSAARVVGEALAKELDDALLQTGDLLLIARVRTLVETGLLESRGDLLDIHRCEVRLPNHEN